MQAARAADHRWRAALVGLALHACSAPPGARAPESAPDLVETAPESAAPGRERLPAAPAGTPDSSPTLTVYHAAGVPEVERAWSVSDYERCLQAFVQILRNGRGALPRSGSVRSGALFARIVEARNFELSSAATPGERARTLGGYLELFPGFLQLYSPANDGVNFSAEQTELSIALLWLLRSALDSSRDFSRLEPSWAERYESQKAMARGVLRGLGSMLLEHARYPEAQRQRLQAELDRSRPALARHLDRDNEPLR